MTAPIPPQLALLAANPKLIGELCNLIGDMPNIDFPTAGGKVCWNTLEENSGWRLQQNKFTGHCRLLNPENIRKAWGSKECMFNAFERFNKQFGQASTKVANSLSVDTIEKLSEIARMYKDGILTEEEFNKLKQQLI
ncbi:SHOCT domain-containing protein [Lysinibacillus capsici]|uniref:SHOCT domain-containing protein n=1 Tax=Lysinibacillus TaxID=400634 RepID=UPI002588C45D|nr:MULTISPECIES: SHOCT domain-containing protein [Lysinibacillus]